MTARRRGTGTGGRVAPPPLILCDPPREPFWPLAAPRPAAEILAGCLTFRERWDERAGPVSGLWCDPVVAGCAFRGGRSGAPRHLNAWPPSGDGYRIAIATWIPPEGWDFGDEPAEHRCGGAPVAWRVDPEQGEALAGESACAPYGAAALVELLVGIGLPAGDAGGRLLDSIWAVVTANPELIAADAAGFRAGETVTGVDPVVLLGERPRVGPEVAIGPFAVLDASGGPIVLDRGARVEPYAVCRGPLYVGRGSAVLGGAVGLGTSIGPRCRVRGEVEQTIFQGFANKAHDGFVGHSAIGEWVNLGAGTITSDLKNTYGTVRVSGPEGRVDTGLLKLGTLLGDHVKTGIGSLLATGARLGVGTHFFGGRGVSPAWLPDFSWHDGTSPRPVRLDAFLRTAAIAMGRRGEELTDAERTMLEALHGVAAVSRTPTGGDPAGTASSR